MTRMQCDHLGAKGELRRKGDIWGKMGKDKMVVFKQEPGEKLTRSQQEGTAALAKMRDEDIDYSDIPELTVEMWRNAVARKSVL